MSMKWISVKESLPEPIKDDYDSESYSFVLAYHTVHGVGMAWFWKFRDKEHIESLEEEVCGKYICSYKFVKNKQDADRYGVDYIEGEDAFEHDSRYFSELGTVTHWMPLPEPPVD